MRRRIPVLLLLLAGCAPSAAPPPGPRPESFRLPNGLSVTLLEDRRVPQVAVNLRVRVGSKDEPPGRSGFAHLFEHLMFMGTPRVPQGDYDRIHSEGGVTDSNASTGQDCTDYYAVGPAAMLPTLLWLEADRLEGLGSGLTQEKLDLQRDVVRNERREWENRPYAKAEMAMYPMLYPPGHPYHHPVIGSHEDLEKASLEDARGFWESWYRPNHVCLAVVGDFEVASARAMVERLFGGLPAGPEPARPEVPPAVLGGVRREVLRDAVELPRLSVVWHSPAYFHLGDAELDLAARVLAGGKASRLHRRLVLEEGLAQEVSAFQRSAALGSLFQVDVYARPGADRSRIERVLDEELSRFAPDGAELASARAFLELATRASLQSFGALADRLNGYRDALGDADRLEWDLGRYREATAASVGEWTRRVLDPGRRLVLWVLPEGEASPSGPLDSRPEDLPAREFPLPAPEVFLLPNGLEVWHLPRPGGLTHLRLALKAGSALDPPGREGLAALSVDLLGEGAGDLDAAGFARAFESLGSALEAETGPDASFLSAEVLDRDLDAALELLGKAVASPRLDAADVARMRGERIRALQASEDDPAVLADRAGDAAFFGPGHPYAHPSEGVQAGLSAVATEDVRVFVRDRIRPRNAVLVVAGGPDRAALEPRLLRTLGRWAPGPSPAAPAVPARPEAAWRLVVLDRPGAPQTVVRMVLPGWRQSDPDRIGAHLLVQAFTGSFSSRLNRNLREGKGWTYGVNGGLDARTLDGTWVIQSAVETSVTGAALGEILKEFRGIREGGVDSGELEPLRTEAVHAPENAFQALGATAGLLAAHALNGRGPRGSEAVREALKAVRLERVNALASRLDPAAGVLVLVGDRARILPQLEGLGLPVPGGGIVRP